MAPFDGKLLDVDLSTLIFFSTALSYELRLCSKGLCAARVHEGDLPEFVV